MNVETPLYRQVHPGWIRDGIATSQTFRPTSKDIGMLSVHDGDRITAAATWERYVAQGMESFGVLAVTKGECERLGLRVIPDPLPESPEHVLIDFTGLNRSRTRQVARLMARMATARGWLFRSHETP